MEVKEIMKILKDKMKIAVFATAGKDGQPHARHIFIGMANEKGIFFKTHKDRFFYKQLMENPKVAITGKHEEGYLVQVIRIEGEVRSIGREKLDEILEGDPYVDMVYPKERDHDNLQVFHLHTGEGFYHSLSQGHRYTFEINSVDSEANDIQN